MSEYMEKHTVSRLVGSPLGYVGYEEGGQLTDKIRRKPYSVLLFDEIEKAHEDVFNILLQILEDGRLTDSQGRTVNFNNTIIIMTSNVGARMISDGKKLGFEKGEKKEENYRDIKKNVMDELKRTFRPEFLNRIDDVIVFRSLTKEELVQIADLMIAEVQKEAEERKVTFVVTDAAKEYLISKGYDEKNGARPLRRVIQKQIEDELAERYLAGKLTPGTHVVFDFADGEMKIF